MFGYAAIVALRLFLAAGQTIEAIGGADHDDGLFVRSAITLLNGDWLGPYNSLALAKGPGYPLFIAANFWLGLPLHLTETLFYITGCAAFAAALGRFFRGPRPTFVLFAVLCFCPSSFEGETYRILREGIYPALTLWTLAGFIALIPRAHGGLWRFVLAAAAGLPLFYFLITREEGIWLSATLAVLLGVSAWRALRGQGGRAMRIAAALVILAAPVVVAFGAIQAVKAKNEKAYGVSVITEINDGPFEGAYGALLRVKPNPWVPYLPVPKETRARIYAASPAFAELRDRLENSPFAPAACEAIPTTCGDIGGGWFLWAVRDAVRDAGHYPTATAAAQYYERLAREVNAACDQGRLDCGPASSSPIPPLKRQHFTALPNSLIRSVDTLVTYGLGTGARYHTAASLGDETRFAEVEALTRNGLSASNATSFRVRSWAFHPAGPVEIKVVNSAGSPLAASIHDHLASDDVAQAIGQPAANRARYEAAFNGPDAVMQFYQGGKLIGRFVFAAGAKPKVEPVDTAIMAPLGDYTESPGGFDTAPPVGSLTKVDAKVQAARADIQARIVQFYSAITPALAVVTLLAYACAVIALFRGRGGPPVWIATALLGAIAARVLLIALADVTSMPSIQPKHFTAVAPLLYGAAAISIAACWPWLETLVSRRRQGGTRALNG